MKTMIDIGANRTFISIKALHLSYKKQSINKLSSRVILADGYTSISIIARLIKHIRIPPKRTVSVPVSVALFSAQVLFRPSFQLQQRSPIIMLNSSLNIHRHTSFISLHNPTNEVHLLPKGIILGTTTIPTLSFKKDPEIDYSLAQKNICNLIKPITNSEQQDKVKRILDKPVKLFDTTKPTIVINVKSHVIKTLDYPPPSSKPYYSTPAKQDAMYKITQELLQFELIRPSYSPYAAPALLAAKHDGSWRMVVDYKKLNNITIKDNHPLPNMEQTIEVLSNGYQFFSKFDMKSGFWQIPVEEEDRHKTAFITPEGLYEWNVLAQGLKNSPPSFQRVMANILSPCHPFALVYIDVLSILLQHNFQLNPSKYSMFRQQIDYLSHTISKQGVTPTNEKIQAIIKLREASTLAEANKFLGAISWYRQNNCLADYLSRHPIQPNEQIFDEDYDISMLFQGEPPAKVSVPVSNSQFIGAVITGSKAKQIQQ
ncbi:unnamed protein product [Rotaria socialis]|uniref:Reverse transcriptase domain-containing protein n=2 Tax=Rotaria socialis TaxID=392032 RepID=A0A821B8P3_9BILA|nr:unnamed protein product [Rotaria socialis]CAF4587402.1 unnamed protein product [Rotaria socialis]